MISVTVNSSSQGRQRASIGLDSAETANRSGVASYANDYPNFQRLHTWRERLSIDLLHGRLARNHLRGDPVDEISMVSVSLCLSRGIQSQRPVASSE